MFVGTKIQLDIGFNAARDKLAELVRRGLLGRASGGAYGHWQADLARAGPPGTMLGMYRIARVRVTKMVTRAESVLWPIRWEVTDGAGAMVPALDAEIKLMPAGDTTMLAVSGVCRPPLTRQAAGLDPAAAREVGQAMIQAFTSRIATDICSPVTGPDAGQGTMSPEPAAEAAP